MIMILWRVVLFAIAVLIVILFFMIIMIIMIMIFIMILGSVIGNAVAIMVVPFSLAGFVLGFVHEAGVVGLCAARGQSQHRQ
ncbi:MAG: hypothetical protein AAFN04_13295 [Pseudomonadota bacterium]